jgi:hypothetical protein
MAFSSVSFSAILAMLSTEGKGSCLLEFRSLSYAVETVPGEFHVLRCHSGNLCRRAKILTS